MTPPSPTGAADPRIDLYLDGLLSTDELASFERDLAESPALQTALRTQREIDSNLREMYAFDTSRTVTPESPAVIGRADETSQRAGERSRTGRMRLYAAAAVLVIAAGALSIYLQNAFTTSRTIGPAMVYSMVDQPEFVCKDDTEFAAAIKKQLGQPLILAAAPGIESLGWAYGDDYSGEIVGKKTMVLINRVRGEKVLVFMDKLSADRPLAMDPTSGLKLYRQQIGSLVVYEVSPLDQPEVITRLKIPAGDR